MSGPVLGTHYYGILDGVRTIAILVSKPQPDDLTPVYLLAVPPPSDVHARIQMVRDPQHPEMLPVVIQAVERLNGLRKTPTPGTDPLTWGEGRTPRLDDLTLLATNAAALPIDVGAQQIVLSETEDLADEEAADSQAALEHDLQRSMLAARLFPSTRPGVSGGSASARDSPATNLSDVTDALRQLASAQKDALREQRAMAERLTVLERGYPARSAPVGDRGTGVFAMPSATTLGADDRALLADLLAQRPGQPPTAPTVMPPPGLAEASGHAHQSDPANPTLTMLDRATSALELLASSGEAGRISMPKSFGSQLFKLEGARGRVAQDQLNLDFERDPARVVREFEEAVRRLKAPEDPSAPLAATSIVEAWREHVPAKEHALAARVSEAILNAYCALRAGQTAKGMGRLALLLAALEQHVLDGGKWTHRAENILGMPPAPLHLYHAPTADSKPKAEGGKPGLGPLAQFCSPQRATTALAVFKENHP